MTILAIDPGPIESGWCILVDGKIYRFRKNKNDHMPIVSTPKTVLGLERVASYGMAVGAEVFETCFWSGRFYEQCKECKQILRPTRKEIVVHICGTAKAKDANVRQAMIDRWGAPGTKKNPGPTFGMAGDMWAALAVATYTMDFLEGKVK